MGLAGNTWQQNVFDRPSLKGRGFDEVLHAKPRPATKLVTSRRDLRLIQMLQLVWLGRWINKNAMPANLTRRKGMEEEAES